MNAQDTLAQLYDAHHSLHREDLPFWLDLARRARGPILELGCGTGRILLPILEAGLSAVGLDRDRHMLNVLRKKSAHRAPAAPVIQADMAAYRLDRRFDLIILPCNTLSTLDNPTRLSMLNRAAEHLTPGGIFAASLPNPWLLSSLPLHADLEFEESFTLPPDGCSVQVSSAWEQDTAMFKLYWQYDLSTPSGKVEQYSVTSIHQLISASQYLAEIEAAGLKIIAQYGEFNRRPFARRARFLIILAQKTGELENTLSRSVP